MNKLNILFIAVSSLVTAQAAVADNAMPIPIFADITPAYRTGDLHNYNGEAMVRVTQISGQDQNGEWVVLFHDKSGALLPIVELNNVAMLINPALVDNEGEYTNLTVTLANKVLTISNNRIEHGPLPPKLAGKVLSLRGSVYVGKYEVTTNGLEL